VAIVADDLAVAGVITRSAYAAISDSCVTTMTVTFSRD
jgi:hypothetical protein